MVIIKTQVNTLKSGKVTITAKSGKRQKTTDYDQTRTLRANVATAAGVLGNLILSDEQQAKVHHPSGRQRVTFATFNDGSGIVNIDV